jgi:pilus assembly protein CpaF
VLSNAAGPGERLIVIEDSAEIKIPDHHVVYLETRPENLEGKGSVEVRDLLRNALRMRPDRIIIGECRGREALDLISAMNTGHEGCLSTVHANSSSDCLARLISMALMSEEAVPVGVVVDRVCPGRDRAPG